MPKATSRGPKKTWRMGQTSCPQICRGKGEGMSPPEADGWESQKRGPLTPSRDPARQPGRGQEKKCHLPLFLPLISCQHRHPPPAKPTGGPRSQLASHGAGQERGQGSSGDEGRVARSQGECPTVGDNVRTPRCPHPLEALANPSPECGREPRVALNLKNEADVRACPFRGQVTGDCNVSFLSLSCKWPCWGGPVTINRGWPTANNQLGTE